MKIAIFAAAILLGGCPTAGLFAADSWPQWRGPGGDGRVVQQNPPLTWNADQNVAWKTRIPGRGHSSPVIDRGRIFLTSADEQAASQSVLAFNAVDGKPLWERTLFHGGLDEKTHLRNSHASCTVACGGEFIYVSFLNDNGIWVTALDEAGSERWRRRVGDFTSLHGYSASPCLHGNLVIVAADHSDGGYITALDGKTGQPVWSTERPKSPNYTSPIVQHTQHGDQLLIAGCAELAAYDPNTGEPLWTADATTKECVGTVVVDGNLAFASGGFPKKETVGVRLDGSGEVVWRNKIQSYVPSLLAHEGYVYCVIDAGIAYCWNSKTGEEMWKERLGGTFNASAILAGDNLYAIREDGTTFVFRATPEKFDLVAENQLGTDVFATPTFVDDRIYLRAADRQHPERQEMLYCVSTSD